METLGETLWKIRLCSRMSHNLEYAHTHWESPKGDAAFLTCIWSAQLFTCGCLWSPHRPLELLRTMFRQCWSTPAPPSTLTQEGSRSVSNLPWFPGLPKAHQAHCRSVFVTEGGWRWPEEGPPQDTLLCPSSRHSNSIVPVNQKDTLLHLDSIDLKLKIIFLFRVLMVIIF